MTKIPNKSRPLRRCACIALTLAGTPASAAELTFKPYVSGQYLYDSNVYKFSRQVAEVTNTTNTADHIRRYIGGVDAGYEWQQQKLQAKVEGRRFIYERLDHLDHDEFALDAGLVGGILSTIRGALNLRDERRMASFEDRRSTGLIMERDQIQRGGIKLAVTPDWNLVAGARHRRLHSPLPDAPALPQPAPGAPARRASPDFTLRETAYQAGVQYGVENKDRPEDEAPLLAGVLLEQQTVSFSGVTPQPPPPAGVTPESFDGYRLLSLQATAEYAIDGLSSFDGKLGVTQYRPGQSGGESSLDVTGEIGYVWEVSAVTELNAHLFSRIVPNAATADATADTGASVGARWQPLLDLTLLADYAWARSSFRGLSGTSSDNSSRSDKAQNARLSISYALFERFELRVFGTYSDRRSNLSYNNYTEETSGVELSFRWL